MTWCSAASIRSARRAATSRAPRRSPPATATRSPGVQINRFCASGLDAINFAAAQVMSGQHDMTIGGGVESMSRVGMGASGGAWPMDPSDRDPDLLHAAGHLGRPDRDQIRLLARRRRRLCGREPEALQGLVGRRQLQELGRAGEGRQRHHDPRTRTSTCGRPRRCSRSAQLQPSFVQMGEMYGFDAVAMQALSRGGDGDARASRRQFVRHRRWRGGRADRQQGGRREDRHEAARAHPRVRQYRLRARDHAHRPDRRDARRC